MRGPRAVLATTAAILLVTACSGAGESSDTTVSTQAPVEPSTAPTTAVEPATSERAGTTTTPPPATTDPGAPPCADEAGGVAAEGGARRGSGEEREVCLDGEWVADPLLDTDTTVPTDDELRAATIPSGRYVVPEQMQFGFYRVSGAWVVRDGDGVEVAADAVDPDLSGYSLLSVSFDTASVDLDGRAVPLDFIPAFDPLAEAATQGTYLVGTDIAPGTYRVTNPGGAVASRLVLADDGGEWVALADESGAETVTITVEPADFAFRYSGTLERE